MKKIELLAPAGGPAQYIAAVENGADAVYVGGPQFNARINAENFILEELQAAVDYGHLRGVRTFVAMNTLMKDEELDKALNYAKQLYIMGVDALIIQDLGLGLRIMEEMPDFELHLSTQASVYNAEGVRAAKTLGYQRVVLARELSLAEIKECTDEADKLGVEIEVFVHGALCYCYSGQCQLSRYIGLYAQHSESAEDGTRTLTRSGNRGTCAQPCRLPYTYIYEDGKKSDNRYPLSPKDLCIIDSLGELVDMGVTSLKIEGRMKSAEYVAVVTGIYRKYIDMYLKKGRYTVSKEDRDKLAQIFNRGGFTEGYSHIDPEDEFMCGTTPKNQGVEIGKILSSKGNYATVELTGPLDMHDVVEIRQDNADGETANNSFKVTYLQRISPETVKIGDIKDRAEYGDKVYRLVSDKLLKEAGASLNGPGFGDIKFSGPEGRKTAVNMTLIAKKSERLKLNVSSSGISSGKITVDEELAGYVIEQAVNKITTEGDMESQLRKTGNTPFAVGKVRLITDDDIFIPLSKLNELRRNALDKLADCMVEQARRKMTLSAGRKTGDTDSELNEISSKNEEATDISMRRLIFSEAVEAENIVVLPQITKGSYDNELRNAADSMVAKLADAKGAVIVNNIGELMLLNEARERLSEKKANEISKADILNSDVAKDASVSEPVSSNADINIIGGYGLNIYNEETVRAYGMLGMRNYIMASEAYSMDEMQGIPLMVTEHRMVPGTLIDRKGARYVVEYNPEIHKSYIFSE